MLNTSLCYLERDGQYLMLHRIKKQQDVNQGKWIGVGGKFEWGETPEECVIREVREETGLTLRRPKLRGIITFSYESQPTEYMFLFTGSDFSGEMIPPESCPEGILRWVDKDAVESLPIWEGDRIFLRFLKEERPFFSLGLRYEGDRLTAATLDGEPLPLAD